MGLDCRASQNQVAQGGARQPDASTPPARALRLSAGDVPRVRRAASVEQVTSLAGWSGTRKARHSPPSRPDTEDAPQAGFRQVPGEPAAALPVNEPRMNSASDDVTVNFHPANTWGCLPLVGTALSSGGQGCTRPSSSNPMRAQ